MIFTNKSISNDDLVDILGWARFQCDRDINNDVAGVVTGLAWTHVGGEILFIESSLSKGKGQLSLTGNLGDVMKESATIAFEYLKSLLSCFNSITYTYIYPKVPHLKMGHRPE